jgi:hypothetical protein
MPTFREFKGGDSAFGGRTTLERNVDSAASAIAGGVNARGHHDETSPPKERHMLKRILVAGAILTSVPAFAQELHLDLAACRANHADCLKSVQAASEKRENTTCAVRQTAVAAVCIAAERARLARDKAGCSRSLAACNKKVADEQKELKQTGKRPKVYMHKPQTCHRVEIPCRSDGPRSDCYRTVCD